MEPDTAFILRALRVTFENDDRGSLFWRADDKGASFFIICNDLFAWGSSDLEELTPANIGELERAYADCRVAGDDYSIYAGSLFCARVRKMRPQGAAYPKPNEYPRLIPLFDACGPVRDVGPGNPYPSPVA